MVSKQEFSAQAIWDYILFGMKNMASSMTKLATIYTPEDSFYQTIQNLQSQRYGLYAK